MKKRIFECEKIKKIRDMYVVHQGQIYKYKDKDKDNLSYSLILYPSLLFPLYFLKTVFSYGSRLNKSGGSGIFIPLNLIIKQRGFSLR